MLGDGRLAVSGDFQHSQPSIPGLLYPDSDPSDTSKNLKPEDWLKIIRTQISPLTHERGHRWPLMLIAGVGFKPLPEADIQMLLARGIVQHLEPKETSLPAARALQKAGSLKEAALLRSRRPTSARTRTRSPLQQTPAHRLECPGGVLVHLGGRVVRVLLPDPLEGRIIQGCDALCDGYSTVKPYCFQSSPRRLTA